VIRDCGHKEGINGVDNARFWFQNVRIPKEHLLNKYADIDSDGNYTSPISDNLARFALHLGIYLFIYLLLIVL